MLGSEQDNPHILSDMAPTHSRSSVDPLTTSVLEEWSLQHELPLPHPLHPVSIWGEDSRVGSVEALGAPQQHGAPARRSRTRPTSDTQGMYHVQRSSRSNMTHDMCCYIGRIDGTTVTQQSPQSI